MKRILTVLALLAALMPAAARADSHAAITEMRATTLAQLYKEDSSAAGDVARAEGYAVFSSGGVNLLFVSAAYGSGVAHDNRSGKDTFMKMASGGVGLGLGIKDYRMVFVFRTRAAYDEFIQHGWDFSGQADAAAKAGTSGDAITGAGNVIPGVKIYQLTQSGLALQATLQGTKYWKE